jgi:hypothetical protein
MCALRGRSVDVDPGLLLHVFLFPDCENFLRATLAAHKDSDDPRYHLSAFWALRWLRRHDGPKLLDEEAQEHLVAARKGISDAEYRYACASMLASAHDYESAMYELSGLYPDVPLATISASRFAVKLGDSRLQRVIEPHLRRVPRTYYARYRALSLLLRSQHRYLGLIPMTVSVAVWTYKISVPLGKLANEFDRLAATAATRGPV